MKKIFLFIILCSCIVFTFNNKASAAELSDEKPFTVRCKSKFVWTNEGSNKRILVHVFTIDLKNNKYWEFKEDGTVLSKRLEGLSEDTITFWSERHRETHAILFSQYIDRTNGTLTTITTGSYLAEGPCERIAYRKPPSKKF